jgi:hypothetical protein
MQPFTWNIDSQNDNYRVFTKWHNFLGNNGWTPIDLTPVEAGGVFSISQAPYAISVPTLANDWYEIQSTNTYDIWNKIVRNDAPKSITKRYPTARPVAGISTGNGVLFSDAFPALNADRLIQLHEKEIRDLVVFNSEPHGQGQVTIPFEVDFGTLPILKSNGRGQAASEADFRQDASADLGLSFTTSRFRGIKIKQPRIWDSSGKGQAISIVGKVVGSRFIGRKVIDRSFFSNAVFPVYTDTTSTFFPDPDPETTSVDGYTERGSGTGITWSDIHDGAGSFSSSGSGVDTLRCTYDGTSGGSGWLTLNRIIILFDTSSLPDALTITAANINMYCNTTTTGLAGQSVVIVGSTPASNTNIVNADYSQTGTTAYSATTSVTSITQSAYNAFALNATGLSNLTATGVSKFAMRMETDRTNSEPTTSGRQSSWAWFLTAETTGTSQDPYLDVTYTLSIPLFGAFLSNNGLFTSGSDVIMSP